MKNLTKTILMFITITGFIVINSIVNAGYEKPTAPNELSSEIIIAVNSLLDKVYNKKSDLIKYPTDQKYIDYLDKVNLGLNNLKPSFNSSDSRYILISYFSSGITNIKNSVQNSSNILDSLSNIINDNDTGSTQANVLVNFNGNGGDNYVPTSKTVIYNTAIGTLPSNPTKTGYTFNGWFTAPTGGTKISISTIITTNITYYAQWTLSTTPIATTGPVCAVSPTSIGSSTEQNVYVKSSDGSLTLSETCHGNDGKIPGISSKGIQCQSTSTNAVCSKPGNIFINGKEVNWQNNTSGYCYADSACANGYQCNSHLCGPKIEYKTFYSGDSDTDKINGSYKRTWNGKTFGDRQFISCLSGSHNTVNNICVSDRKTCTTDIEGQGEGTSTYGINGWGDCIVSTCTKDYVKDPKSSTFSCIPRTKTCTPSNNYPNEYPRGSDVATGITTWDTQFGSYRLCQVVCKEGYKLNTKRTNTSSFNLGGATSNAIDYCTPNIAQVIKPIRTLTADKKDVKSGEVVTFSYNTTGNSGCYLKHLDKNNVSLFNIAIPTNSPIGTKTWNANVTSGFILQCSSIGGFSAIAIKVNGVEQSFEFGGTNGIKIQ